MGQGVIARGRMGTDGVFVAEEVLASATRTTLPPEVAKTLKKQHEKPAATGPLPTT